MTSTSAATPERRKGTRTAIDKLLAERQEVLRLLYRVAGIEPYSGSKPRSQEIEHFCELLVDYVAAGHFGLYQRISEGRERRRAVLDVAAEVYPRVAATTDAVVAFSDRYARGVGDTTPEVLKHDLSQVGEQLATRVELEDRLITALLEGR